MEWVELGCLIVSSDGCYVLYVQEDGTVSVHMPCISGYIAHVANYKTLADAYKGIEYWRSEE